MMKQKKTLLVIGLVLLVLVVVGSFYLKSPKNSVSNSESDKSIFTSVKDAVSKKMTIACDFKDETGGSIKSYIKDGSVRIISTGETSSKSGDVLIKDKVMYMWDIKTKQGFIYNIPDSDDSGANSGVSEENIVSSDSYLSMIDRYKDSCSVSVVEDSYFEVPSDVNFQDMSKLLEDMKKNVPSYSLPNQ